ncbi:hypothetical protein [Hymenobacter sp. BT491]|uniref:hypothetical protein n=1 Tax=Hymenobacter sp. BT491 TaxID=2766779 RepID=UPI0016537795|nr:hypothetical protein [Hymenobacter sp. BT491]MBC6990115.1 hypothetical protein [Hymenobacter sp. BT491]
MMKSFALLLALGTIFGLGNCQQTPSAADQSAQSTPPSAPAAVSAGAPTEAEARAAVARYLQKEPNVALFQLDSARVVDVDTHWQVLVPRTDWAKRMPNAAAFDVDKQTGNVTTLRVK